MTGKMRSYHPLLTSMFQIMEALMSMGVLYLCHAVYLDTPFANQWAFLALVAFSLSLLCLNSAGLYRSWRGINFSSELKTILLGCGMVYLVLILLGFAFKVTQNYSRMVVGAWMVCWPLVMILERYSLRKFMRIFRKSGHNSRTAVIIGAGDLGRKLCHWLEKNRWAGVNVVGLFDDANKNPARLKQVLGRVEDAPSYVQERRIDLVYLTLPMREESKIKSVVDRLSDSTASVYYVPDIFCFNLLLSGRSVYFDNIAAIALWESPLVGFNVALKRAFDIAVAGVILACISPLMAAIAAAVKLSSPGPVLFKQWRYGMKGEPILVYKFRSMRVCEDGYVCNPAERDDPRVTPVGRFLRRTSLDELPQFLNVLLGSMSIVGPRPHAVAMNEEYRKLVSGYMLRHTVKPGITGLAQINGLRGGTETVDKMERRVHFDLEYLRKWSPVLDMKIIFKTIPSCIFGENAY